MLDPRAIAVGGVGYGARMLSALGMWPAEEVDTANEEAITGGRRRKARQSLTIEEVQQQWELLDLRTKPNTQEVPEGSPLVAGADQIPVKNAGSEAAMVSGPAMPANYQGILTSSPTDSAGEPLAPDQAAAAIEARRQRNNKALAMLLMEL